MSIQAVGMRAYSEAVQNFSKVQSGLQQGGSIGGQTQFAKTLDQSLLRDSVDRGENFGAQADFIKYPTQAHTPVTPQNLLPPGQLPRRAHPRRRLNLILGAAVLLLLLLVGSEWLHNRQVAVARMQAEVAEMRSDAQQVAALRQQLQDNAGAAGFLAARKKDTIGMLSLLQDLTARLPDSTWLERFSVDSNGQIGMQGQSQQAAKLLDSLKDSPVLGDAGFQGSIQPDPTTGKERFYLTARVKSLATGKSGPATDDTTGAP